jgi:hypothetical protein
VNPTLSQLRFPAGFVFVLIACCGTARAAAPKIAHVPEQPKTSDVVRITARGEGVKRGESLTVQFQVVEPGAYIALNDPEFKTKWVSTPMNDNGRDGDESAGDGIFTATIPANIQVHRRLVRYRILAGKEVIAPKEKDGPNFAYFVYDGAPSWQAAINPQSPDSALSTPVTFGTNVMRSLPIYQLISRKESVENATWYEQAQFGDAEARKRYKYTGTFVADDGKVHDHVRFRARGGQWRYSMGKNMWKIDFPRGNHLQARDNYGRPYQAKWEKLNLGACIQQGSTHYRGEQGMFEAVGFRMFNLAGVEAPETHWIHWRIITGAEESPKDQYSGDFWGLYLATEDVDDAFLKEHRLPAGNVYKLDFGRPLPHTEAQKSERNPNDVFQFVSGMRRATPAWWQANLDLAQYYSYRSIIECIHHYDIYAGKNYFYYLNPETKHWSVIPWDLDLTWANNMHGSGQEPFYQAGLLFQEPFRHEYQNRLREIRDLLYTPEQIDQLIDDCAAIISDPAGGPSLAEADRRKWDYHPIMLTSYVSKSKGRQGEFYKLSPTHDFRGMLQVMMDYARQRGEWIDRTLLTDANIPPTPTISSEPPSGENLKFRTSPASNAGSVQWRVAEISPANSPARLAPRQYEITPLMQKSGEASAEISVGILAKGHTYRVRARLQDAEGNCGHWSAPVQFELQ